MLMPKTTGRRYKEGRGVPQDDKMAVQWKWARRRAGVC
ncbi:MAG: SEL1-like repeat protein [Candidatus Eutrophobiaceae bacterium]